MSDRPFQRLVLVGFLHLVEHWHSENRRLLRGWSIQVVHIVAVPRRAGPLRSDHAPLGKWESGASAPKFRRETWDRPGSSWQTPLTSCVANRPRHYIWTRSPPSRTCAPAFQPV